MKRSLIFTLCLLAASFALPLAIFSSRADALPALETTASPSTPAASASTVAPPAASDEPADTGEPIQAPETTSRITVLVDGVETQMTLDETVAAIVAAEMPALYPAEALKAQAIAARTYICYRAAHPVSAHEAAVLCDNPAHCCALADLNALAAGWGEQGQTYADRIRNAVADTSGQILTYAGEPILAVFHAMSGRTTNSSADVWGGDVPYLVSVDAPAGESALNGWRNAVVFDCAEFRQMFCSRHPSAVLRDGSDWFTDAVRTAGGLVQTIRVGGVTVTGGELRALCGLRSASFTVTQGAGRIRFETEGYGHGVGMSQNGAKVMAADGHSAAAILSHYYPGTTLEPIPTK